MLLTPHYKGLALIPLYSLETRRCGGFIFSVYVWSYMVRPAIMHWGTSHNSGWSCCVVFVFLVSAVILLLQLPAGSRPGRREQLVRGNIRAAA
jgi:hypothetical protein